MEVQVAKVFAAAIAVMPLIAVALSVGRIFSTTIEAIGRNPEIQKNVRTLSIVGAALVEVTALITFIIVMFILS